MRRRARLSSDRASRPDRLSRQADDGRPRDARGRDGARSPGLDGRDHLRMSHDRGRPATAFSRPSGSAFAGFRSASAATSNVRIDPFEELRELEGIARRQTGRRGIFTTAGSTGSAPTGADAIGVESWPGVEIDLEHPALAGTERDDVPAA